MKLILFLFILLPDWTRSEGCVTEANVPCVFPFRYRNKTHLGCTTEDAVDGLAWCSTKVDEAGNHVTGQDEFGPCSPSCSRDLICRVLAVKDLDDDVASGLFVFNGTVHHNKPVYDNREKGLQRVRMHSIDPASAPTLTQRLARKGWSASFTVLKSFSVLKE